MKKVSIVVIGALLVFGALGCSNCMLAAPVRETVEKTITCGANPSLSVENVNGYLKISEGKAGEISFKAEKVVKARDEAKAKALMEKVKVVVTNEGGKVALKTVYPKHHGSFFSFGGRSVAVNYTIDVPRGTIIDVETVNGAVTLNVPASSIKCETVNGAITVKDGALLSASAVNGAIRFKVESVKKVETTNGSVKGELLSLKPAAGSIETVNGSIKIVVSQKAAFRVSAENVNGSVRSDLPGAKASKHHFVAEFNGGGNTISIETVNGSIKVQLPESADESKSEQGDQGTS